MELVISKARGGNRWKWWLMDAGKARAESPTSFPTEDKARRDAAEVARAFGSASVVTR